jgi:hypothetical protein
MGHFHLLRDEAGPSLPEQRLKLAGQIAANNSRVNRCAGYESLVPRAECRNRRKAFLASMSQHRSWQGGNTLTPGLEQKPDV